MTMQLPATYDNTFDNKQGSLNTVACSNGPNGLASRFPTFGNLPTYPNVGGAFAVSGWGSPNCGSCFSITYPETGKSITYTVIDTANPGFNMAQAALDYLTDGKAVQLGKVEVNAQQLPASACGL